MAKKTVEDIDVAEKTVLVRVDYNVPFLPGTQDISDDSRIQASLPTLEYLRDQEAKIIVCSHLGRPGGQVVEELRMAPISRRLSELLGRLVVQAPDCVGPQVRMGIEQLPLRGIVMLENLRFHPGEESNDPNFASALASSAQVFVNDAFGAAHRAHASTQGVARLVPSVAGFLMAKELEMLGGALDAPGRPFVAVLGGAKVSDKIPVLENLAGKVDALIIGGGMAATFLKAQGLEVGDSLVDDDGLPFAGQFIQGAQARGLRVLLPTDVVLADAFAEFAGFRTAGVSEIPPGWRIMDIGPQTAAAFEQTLAGAATVVWNGPMGVFEWRPFSQGTARVAGALAALPNAVTVVGGGSTAEAVQSLGMAERMTHVSTGGGASLEFLEGRELPGVAALMDR